MSEYKFGELIKARLGELKMSQSELAKRLMKGRSYINYVVSGKNKTAKSNTSRPGPESIQLIANELGIPLDDAFAAAGWPQYVGKGFGGGGSPAAGAGARRPDFTGVASADEITIDLPGKMQLKLVSESGPLTGEQIDRYTLAFRTAAAVVRGERKK